MLSVAGSILTSKAQRLVAWVSILGSATVVGIGFSTSSFLQDPSHEDANDKRMARFLIVIDFKAFKV
jgi:Na+/H+ antiporter NhaA